MKKYFGIIFFLPILLFNACEDDDVEKCNDLADDYNTSFTAFESDVSTASCNAIADDILALINEGCTESLAGSDFESWTPDSVTLFKAFCDIIDSGSDDGSFTNCFDGDDTYGPCSSCGYYDTEEEAQDAADCITCPSGYEIDVIYDDCTGYCVVEGTAENPLSSSDCTTP